jgi:hypothetical protein
MAANRYGVDIGAAFRDAEAIKGARTQNKLSALNLSEKEREIAERPEKERLAKERKNKLYQLRTDTSTGVKGAAEQLISLDPENGPAFIEAIGKMDDRKREQVKRSVEEIGQLSSYVLQGKTPEEQQSRYIRMKENISPDAAAKLPENYDPAFMELSLSKAMTMDQLLEAPTVKSLGKQDVAYRAGREVERQNKPVKSGSGSGGAGGLKSADESLMYRQSAELLGGLFDEKGNITNLDPEARNRVQAIATEAANIFVREGNITRSEAVKRAAKQFGMNVKDVPKEGVDNDPLGLLQ